MRKAFILILLINLYPFGCDGQTKPDCDTIYIDHPGWEAERESFQQMIDRLTIENIALREDIVALGEQITQLQSEKVVLIATIAEKNDQIAVLENDLAECLSKPGDTVFIPTPADTVEVLPPPQVNTVYYNTRWDHYQDSTKYWLYAGGKGSLPHNVYIEFKENCLTLVQMQDSLSTFRKQFQTKFRLEQTINYEYAETTYKDLGVPLQFYITDSVVSVESTMLRIRTFQSEPTGITYTVNGVVDERLDATPGRVDTNGGTMWRHTGTLEGLEPNTEYEIIATITNENGETDEATIHLKTLE